jgi:hypothetical protein
VAEAIFWAPPEVEEAEGRPHCQPDRRAPAEVEAEGLHPIRQGAAWDRRLRLEPVAEAVEADRWHLGAEALQVPVPQPVQAAEGMAHLGPAP